MSNSVTIYVDNLPKGSVIMWYREENNIPQGWQLCDGGDYGGFSTPDLRDRFVVGAGSKYYKDQKGGCEKVQLSENQMPQHTHEASAQISQDGKHKHKWRGYYNRQYAKWGEYCRSRNWNDSDPEEDGTNDAGQHTHTATVNIYSTGGGEAHDNLPPYCALFYIIKVE